MFCAISGEAPEEPVVSTKSGHVFEKRLIEKHLSNNSKCPITDQPLSVEDLLPLKVSKTVRPRPATATSIPGMLALFQNEWDALMLETFTLKQQLESVKQELSHALYQHDAACRVIARLIKERDEATKALANFQENAAAQPAAKADSSADKMDVEPVSALAEDVKQKMQAKSTDLSKSRKKRTIPPTLATIDDLKQFQMTSTNSYHQTSSNVLAVDLHPNQDLCVTGGSDKNVVVFHRGEKKVANTLTGHTKKVTDVLFHPSEHVIFSTSADKTARIWKEGEKGYTSAHTFKTHTKDVVGCSLHATGDFLVTGSLDQTWALHDIHTATTLVQVDAESVVNSLNFHPDGLLLAAGTADNVVKIFDVKTQKNVATFEGHGGAVVSVSFSENGYYLASAANDEHVMLWDLRKLKSFHTIELPEKFAVSSVEWDYSGSYLAVAGSDIRIFVGKTLNHAVTLGSSGKFTDIKWGKDAHFLVSSSMDRSLKLWGKKE